MAVKRPRPLSADSFIASAPDADATEKTARPAKAEMIKTTLKMPQDMIEALDNARADLGGLSREAMIRMIITEWRNGQS